MPLSRGPLERLQRQIDLHDLAARLGLKRPGNTGNYRSPKHDDKSPSLSIFGRGGAQGWKDWSGDDSARGGNPPSLVAYVLDLPFGEAVRWCCREYGIEMEPEARPSKPANIVERIARDCVRAMNGAMEYLVGRGIPEDVVARAHRQGALGYNAWHATDREEGAVGYQGPAVCFVVRGLNPGHVAAVDKRFLDPSLNGGVKTWTLGEKAGVGWTSNLARLDKARTVYICESAINALSIEAAGMPYSAAFALRGTQNAKNINWRFLRGRRAIIVPDADTANEKGRRPGPEAAWHIHTACNALDVPCLIVDLAEWYEAEINDVNDLLMADGVHGVKQALRRLEPWAIPGLPALKQRIELDLGKARVFLPAQDEAVYWRYRVTQDFTAYVDRVEEEEGEAPRKLKLKDVAGFRIASIARVSIASSTAVMTGDENMMPRTLFAVSVDVARHGQDDGGGVLLRRVLSDERLHNVDQWRKFGSVFNPPLFSRLINIWERAVNLGGREAANFVGLCWLKGKPAVNQGPDCFFEFPEKQCPYSTLTFPTGSANAAHQVLDAYRDTFTHSAALQALVWALGGHLKAYLGYWPHLKLEARKGSGKSTLLKRMERTLAMTVLSGQAINTDFRMLTSLSHTSHPVGWEEVSARKADLIARAVSMLQEAYNYSLTRRGYEGTEYLICAPVLLSGEDVPVEGLTGKLVRADLTGRKGELIPDGTPSFPVLEWLRYLADVGRAEVIAAHKRSHAMLTENCSAAADDPGGERMVDNYAAVYTAWRLICAWLELDVQYGGFPAHLITEMNRHISDTKCEREPWVGLMETVFSQMSAGQFRHPYLVDNVEGEPCLIIRVNHIVDHLAHTPALRDVFAASSLKSRSVFTRRLEEAGVIHKAHMDRRVNGVRYNRMQAISLEKLEQWGLSPPVAELDTAGMGQSWGG